ncbi:MAG: MATE family efflux transporter [Oscillospiraceae bacterium]
MARQYEMDMCSGSVLKKLLLFTLPLMASSILQLLFNAADIIVVGRFAGDNSLAAVGSNTALINLLTNLFVGLSVGVNVVAARAHGAGDRQKLSDVTHTAILLSLFSGLFLAAVGLIFAPQLLALMQTPEGVLPLAVTYLRIYFAGMPFVMLYNFGAALLRSVGDTKRPLYFLVIAGIINVALNLVFVILLKMDVAGVALATVISQTISAVLILLCLAHEQGGIRLEIKKLRIRSADLADIIRVGLPAGFQGVVFALSNVVIQSSINLFGDITVAGNSAAANIEGFIYMAMNSFYQAAISFTGQHVGARRFDRIPKILFCAQLCVVATGLILGWSAYIFGRPLLGIYTETPAAIDAGMARMSVISTTYFLCGIMDVMVGMLRGLGYSVVPMIVSLAGACGLRILWIATVFQIEQYHNVFTVYLSYPITWVITLTAHIICFIIVWKKLKKREADCFRQIKREKTA